MMSKYRDKKIQKGSTGTMETGKSALSSKANGFISRKLPTREEALGRTDNANIRIRKADQVSASFALRARRAKDKDKKHRQN